MRTLERAIDAVITIAGYVAAAMIIATMLIITAAMLSRNFLGPTLPWAHELATWTAAGSVFLGGGYALINGAFIRVDVIFSNFPAPVQRTIDAVLGTACVFLMCSVIIWFGTRFAVMSWNIGEVSSTGAWRGRVWILKGLLPIGAVLLVLAWISHLIKLFTFRHH